MTDHSKIKISFFVPALNAGGAQKVMIDLASELSLEGFIADIVLVKAQGEFLKSVPDTVHITDLGKSRTLFSIFALAKYIRVEKPNIILSTLPHANVIAIWSKILSRSYSKVIIREATLSSHIVYKTKNFLTAFISHFISRLTYSRADAIVAVSEGVANDTISFYKTDKRKIHTINNPVDFQKISELSKHDITHLWMNDSSIPVIVSVGRLSKEKDYPTLLRAISIVRKSTPVRLIILGEGNERKFLESLISDMALEDSVDMPGFVDNPFPYIKNASVFVMSSICEGMPNALLQAVFLGTPAISTDCISGPNEILDGGRLGMLVEVGHPYELSKAILKTICSPITRSHSIDPYLERYSKKNIIDSYKNLILKYCNE